MKNTYIVLDDDTIEMTLTQGKTCVVDISVIPLFAEYKWYAVKDGKSGKYYVYAHLPTINGKQKTPIKLHRIIMGITDPKVQIDHIDGDTLNNRKSNLRVATNSQNGCNRSAQSNSTTGEKNISWRKDRNKYNLRIEVNGKRKHCGYFDTLEEAIARRNELLPLLHKEFANTK